MKVCIAEKPSVAKEIAQIIGASSRRDGYYEGNGFQVTWTFGHLCTLKEPHDYTDRWKQWNMAMLPMLPDKFGIKLIDDAGVKKQFAVIEKLVGEAEWVINCGDAGQEGELIQRWVLAKAGYNKPMKRLWISSLTEEAIKEGFAQLRDGAEFEKLYAAGSARAIGDWLLGMNATRLYTLKYGQNKQVLSIGRVQTPTLSLIVKRQLEIDNFKPEPYWELKTRYRDTLFSAAEGRFQQKEEAAKILDTITGHPFTIVSYEKKAGTETSPRLFDLTSLQVECNRKHGFTAEETLKYIQSLYEKKLTTYPRVDTTYLSDDIYKKVPEILGKLSSYEKLTAPLLKEKIRKSSKIFDDSKITDHHAIIPTGITPSGLNPDERKVYDMVARRFISVFYPDCKIANTTVVGETNGIGFKATGKQILEPGWRAVYADDSGRATADTINEEHILPVFEKGEHGPHQPELAEKMTQPPKFYTEATLLRAMETSGKNVEDEELRQLMKENGIGRPSTRANIIETLFRRKYIVRNKKNIVATATGIELIESIENELLKSAELTGIWEKKLRQIEAGSYDVSEFMKELKTMVAEVVEQVKRSPRKVITVMEDEKAKGSENGMPKGQQVDKANGRKREEANQKMVCPKCGNGVMMQGKTAWGCSGYREGCNFRLPFVFMGKKLTEAQIKSLCSSKKTGEIKGFETESGKRDGIILLDETFQLQLEEREKGPLRCPRCTEGTILKGKSAWGCSNFRNGCAFRLPFEFEGKKITDRQMGDLIRRGKSGKLGFDNDFGLKTGR